MEYVLVCIGAIVLENGLLRFFNRKEPEYRLDHKKYGAILTVGNILLMVLAAVLEARGIHPALWYFGLCSYLFCLSIYDIRFRELPDCFHLVAILFYCYLLFRQSLPYSVKSGLLAAAVTGLFLIVVYLIRKDAIGFGDIKVIILCAQYTAGMIAGIVIRGMAGAFLCGIVLLLLRKVDTKYGLPFVPFLFFGALLM